MVASSVAIFSRSACDHDGDDDDDVSSNMTRNAEFVYENSIAVAA